MARPEGWWPTGRSKPAIDLRAETMPAQHVRDYHQQPAGAANACYPIRSILYDNEEFDIALLLVPFASAIPRAERETMSEPRFEPLTLATNGRRAADAARRVRHRLSGRRSVRDARPNATRSSRACSTSNACSRADQPRADGWRGARSHVLDAARQFGIAGDRSRDQSGDRPPPPRLARTAWRTGDERSDGVVAAAGGSQRRAAEGARHLR